MENDEQPKNDGLPSVEEMEKMTKAAEKIAILTEAIATTMYEAAVKPVNKDVEKSNVIYINPAISNQFNVFAKTPSNLPNTMGKYLEWAEDVWHLVKMNKDRLKKGTVRDHIISNFRIIQTIEQVLTTD